MKNWEKPSIKVEIFEVNESISSCLHWEGWGVSCNVTASNAVQAQKGYNTSDTHAPNYAAHSSDHCGLVTNQYIDDFINGTMTEVGTDGLGTLTCTIYGSDSTYTTPVASISAVSPGDYIYWTTTSGNRTWYHQGKVVSNKESYSNRS